MITRLTKDFALDEFTMSATATARGIDNAITADALANIAALATNLLQPLRDRYKMPMRVNSGYRCPALNAAVGGVPSSQHVKGEAADIGVADPKRLLTVLMDSGLEFDQAIRYPSFLHLSYKRNGENRGQVLIHR